MNNNYNNINNNTFNNELKNKKVFEELSIISKQEKN